MVTSPWSADRLASPSAFPVIYAPVGQRCYTLNLRICFQTFTCCFFNFFISSPSTFIELLRLELLASFDGSIKGTLGALGGAAIVGIGIGTGLSLLGPELCSMALLDQR